MHSARTDSCKIQEKEHPSSKSADYDPEHLTIWKMACCNQGINHNLVSQQKLVVTLLGFSAPPTV